MALRIGSNIGKSTNNVPGRRADPYLAYNFLVEINGITVAGFTEVSGLTIDTQVERKTFGGENDREYAFITQTKYTDITLRQGLTDQDLLWNWYADVIKGKVVKRNGSIYLLDHTGVYKVWWNFFDAFPIKWEGPALNAGNNTVAIEALVLAHGGLSRHK